MSDIRAEIQYIRKAVDEIRTKDIPELKVAIAKLQVKAGIWGGIAGIVAIAAAVLLKTF